MKDRELPICAGAFPHDPFDVRHLAFAAELFDFGRNEFEQFVDQTARLNFGLAPEID